MINAEVLEAASYRRSLDRSDPHMDKLLFQKTIYNLEDAKCYFITVTQWDWGDLRIPNPPKDQPESYSSGATFFLPPEGSKSFEVHYHVEKETTVEEIEAFFTEIYRNFRCIPDIHNN